MVNSAAKVVRIKIPDSRFGVLANHSSGNLLNRPFQVYSPTQEDEEYVAWGNTSKEYSVVSRVLALTPYNTTIKVFKIVENNPIPNSDRWIAKQTLV